MQNFPQIPAQVTKNLALYAVQNAEILQSLKDLLHLEKLNISYVSR